MQRKKTAIIIGGGISGVSAAEELIKQGYSIKILEKNDRLGGKIYSAREFSTAGGAPELGAMVMTSNYPTIDTVLKHHIEVREVLPTALEPMNEVIFKKRQPSLYDQAVYGLKFLWQNITFARHVWSYQSASQQLKTTAPTGQSDTFDVFCKKNKLDVIADFQKIWIPGMGYGDLQHNPAYRIMNYMGYGTMPSLVIGSFLSHCLLTVPHGYQTIVEKMAEEMDVEKSVTVTRILRDDKEGVTVEYTNKNNEKSTIQADYVVLTMSPYYWQNLHMELTPTEQQCVKQLQRIPYSTAVVDIGGYSNNQVFVPEALDEKGFGHVGFISTKGEGRCVVYINRNPADEQFTLAEGSKDRETMLNDLKKLGYDKVTILKTEDWPDYNATIPWELGMELEKQQGKNGTLYVGSFRPTSFESVAAAEASSRATIQKFLNTQESKLESAKKHIKRAYHFFFTLPQDINANSRPSVHEMPWYPGK